MEAACDGYPVAKDFVRNSGIKKEEFIGAILNSRRSVDGQGGPQDILNQISIQLGNNKNLMIDFRLRIVDILMKEYGIGKYKNQINTTLKGGMRLQEAEVDILFIVCNNDVVFISEEMDHLFEKDKDGDERLQGRVVNFVFSGQLSGAVIEVFIAFDDSDSYTMFSLQAGTIERLDYVTHAIFKYFAKNGIKGVFSPAEQYSTQYIYTFRLYKKNEQYFMVNNHQTQAYLIDHSGIMRDDVDAIKSTFWG